jgi:pimeloyl-ACP methyl ester carboxylesterase
MMSKLSSASSIQAFADASADYSLDAWQRWILFLDVMRRRAEQYEAHAAQGAPHVLDYEAELICDARTFEEPVNYGLVRIIPPAGIVIDPLKRPFIVVDPRAGHGPGIGGFKADSEIGVAMKAGHACYFIGFLPDPMPGQTIEKIARAEAQFLEMVISRHPEADGKPCVIGNCQAGWAVMMLAALRPELFGPIIVAGAPLAYWAGVHGQNPMRYSGGLLGGSWLTALVGDLGAGQFDGAWLVQNFENQNPANTLWTKQYNLYSKIDTEAERYLGFERWWGGHVTLNAEEMQFIVDELFIGNKLATGDIHTSDGTTIDLRTIRSPIVIFCSKGDNVTPPQQALDWILDLYGSVDEIRSLGQTIVYVVHEKIGHLGIFVSGGVARKEHDEFASNIDLIDVLPPGLYEAVLEPKGGAIEHPELVTGEWVMRCERRTLDDIRALGGNDPQDENRFAAAARLSEINLALYRAFFQPAVKAAVNPSWAEAMRRLHPLRLSYELFGTSNPFLAWVGEAAELVREDRRPAGADNPFLAFQEQVSGQIVEGLERWRKVTERLAEETFGAVYGSPVLQAALGIDPLSNRPPHQAPKSMLISALIEARTAALKEKIPQGGPVEALVRSLLFVCKARGGADEREFEAIRRIRRDHRGASRLNLSAFKALVREQYYILLNEETAALAAIPAMLPKEADERRAAFEVLQGVLEASGALDGAAAERFERLTELFGLGKDAVSSEPTPLPTRTAPRNRSV